MRFLLNCLAKQKSLRGIVVACVLAVPSTGAGAQAAAPAEAGSAIVKKLGSIRTIDGSQLVIAPDQGRELQVEVQSGARLLRLQPGQTELKDAAPIAFSDLQIGDRVLVRGKMGADGTRLNASTVLVMKQQDIAQRRQKEMKDWQHRSVGGLVQDIDARGGMLTISVARLSGAGEGPQVQRVVVRTSAKTAYKRYAADSMRWEQARDSSFGEIRPGDQLRVLGDRSQDGAQIEAEEIVFGSFRNISGLIVATNPSQGTITVQDLATKSPVTVKITDDSQIRKLPPQIAQALARRLKGGVADEAATAADAGKRTSEPRATAPGPGARRGDLNQMLSRLPATSLGDLQKGEAVMIVSTLGSSGQLPTAITVLDGAEPILTANPGGRGSESLLTPWTLASAPTGGDQP